MASANWDLILAEAQALHEDMVAWTQAMRKERLARKVQPSAIELTTTSVYGDLDQDAFLKPIYLGEAWPDRGEPIVADRRLERLEAKIDTFETRLERFESETEKRLASIEERLKLTDA